MRLLRLKDLVLLLRVSRGTRIAVHEFMRKDFNADNVLMRFIPDIDAFQAVQARTQAIIGGSIALSFFVGVTWPTMKLFIQFEDAEMETPLPRIESGQISATRIQAHGPQL